MKGFLTIIVFSLCAASNALCQAVEAKPAVNESFDFSRAKRSSAAEWISADSQLSNAVSTSTNFQRLRRSATTIEINGRSFYIVEGDLLLDEEQLKLHARSQELQTELTKLSYSGRSVPKLTSFPLKPDMIVDERFGKPVIWKEPTALTYSILKKTFSAESLYRTAVTNMAKASRDWERICGVRFLHKKELDEKAHPVDGDGVPIGVTFIVQQRKSPGGFIALAFFPNDPGYRRNLFLDPSYFETSMEYDPVGVLRHELGHVLGFRHEHIHTGAPAECPGESTGRTIALSDYTPTSVMHYFCGGVGDRQLRIQPNDETSAQKVYGAPLGSVLFAE